VVGVNPKVNNLIRSYRQAENDILWVLDSNILVDRGTLARSVDVLTHPLAASSSKKQKRIALVHHVPFAFSGKEHFGSAIEEAFLNTNHAKMYIAINKVAVESCVVGKSCLYRRSDIERVNGTLKPIPNPASGGKQDGECGLAVFGRFLPEDNMIASALWHELDLRHDLSCDIAQNAVGRMTVMDYIQRRVRWIRVRKYMTLGATLVEPLTECIALSLVGAFTLQHLFGVPWWLIILIHYPAWIMVDLDVFASLAGEPLPSRERWGFLLAWAMRELLAFPIWLVAIWGNTVVWRGKVYTVLPHGEVKRTSGRNDNYERLADGTEVS
jgi:ceramide glucosyltransferase